ncbi:GPI19 [Candida pseudojiufengensis]|uniref:GPI19 n=1 Tax=Candida pseudojiufengensis TaxID=497109 RepID=UPI00222462A1|nr:GPI19 [Candida pseudojiufengensis]KAI5963785.1 GPI19 [Candida pseudojiufengensis]
MTLRYDTFGISRSASPKPILRTIEDDEIEEAIQAEEVTILSNQDKLARESDVTVSNIHQSQAEYSGFTIYVLSSLSLILYILWSLTPPHILTSLSIDYYPDKYWSIAIPSYSLMLMLFTYIALALYNTEILTLKLNDINTFVDSNSQFPGESKADELSVAERNKVVLDYAQKAPSGVWDLPITLVNEELYDRDDD